MKRVYVDVDSLSIEDVNSDAAEEFGSFGALHEEDMSDCDAMDYLAYYYEEVRA